MMSNGKAKKRGKFFSWLFSCFGLKSKSEDRSNSYYSFQSGFLELDYELLSESPRDEIKTNSDGDRNAFLDESTETHPDIHSTEENECKDETSPRDINECNNESQPSMNIVHEYSFQSELMREEYALPVVLPRGEDESHSDGFLDHGKRIVEALHEPSRDQCESNHEESIRDGIESYLVSSISPVKGIMSPNSNLLPQLQSFDGVPDPSAIVRKWLEHPSTLELDKKIFETASKKEIVSHQLFNRMTNHLIIRFSCSGVQTKEALHQLKWGHVYEAFKKGYACYPYNKLHLNPAVNISEVKKRVVSMKDGEQVYIRPDPWSVDYLDPEDPRKNIHRFYALKGLCCTLHEHKMCDKYPCYIFFNLIDVKYLLAYEEISKNRMQHLGIKTSTQSSVFVNGEGGSFANDNSTLDLTGFCEVVGLPRCTYSIFRDMYVGKVYSSQIGKH